MVRTFFIYYAIIATCLGYAFLLSQNRFRLSAGVTTLFSLTLASIFIFFVGFRTNVGEQIGYEYYFQTALNHGTESLAFLELGFLWLLEFATLLSEDPTVLFIIFALLQVVLLFRLLNRLDSINPYLLVTYFFTTLVFFQSLNITREHIACLAALNGIFASRLIAKSGYFIFAVLFHQVTFLMISLASLAKILSTKSLVIVFLFLLGLWSINFNFGFSYLLEILADESISGRLSGYVVNNFTQESGQNFRWVTVIFNILVDIYIIFYLYTYKRNDAEGYLHPLILIFIVGAILSIMASISGAILISRIAGSLYISKFILLSTLEFRKFSLISLINVSIFVIYIYWMVSAAIKISTLNDFRLIIF
jgi:hypothetical protein